MIPLPRPMRWRQWLLWLWKHDPQRFREPEQPKPEPKKAPQYTQERML